MKKVLCFIVIAAITLGMATGCEKKGPEKNVFSEVAIGKTFSMTYQELFASFNSRVEPVSRVGEVEFQDQGIPKSNVVYSYPIAGDRLSFLLYVDTETKKVYSLDHFLQLDNLDETERQQWVERVRALILSIDLDMDEKGCEKLMKKLGVFNCAALKDGYSKSVVLHGIWYGLQYDVIQEYGSGRVMFSCAPYRN